MNPETPGRTERPWCTCGNPKNGPERDCPVHRELYEVWDRQMQAAFDAEAQHRDCCCDDVVNPFCKTHGGRQATPPPPAEKPTDREIAEALCAADSILSLLRWRGLVNSELNREDVNAAAAKLEALRWWHEPMLRTSK
jgi:hypothetical protein